MILRFFITYHTTYGKELQIYLAKKRKNDIVDHVYIPMEYTQNDRWMATLDTEEDGYKNVSAITYTYQLKEHDTVLDSLDREMTINLKKYKGEDLIVVDEWVREQAAASLFSTKPFETLKALPKENSKKKFSAGKQVSHIIKISATGYKPGLVPCIVGAGKKLGSWEEGEVVFPDFIGGQWVASLQLHKESFPLEYKIALFDHNSEKVVAYEAGDNRKLLATENKDSTQLIQIISPVHSFAWKGTGLNVQLSSIKTNSSWGVGDFTDLRLLTDWAASMDIKMLQLLPVNDTTATHTAKDSYPYSAVSAFALHPAFLNVEKLAKSFSVEVPETVLEEIAVLNDKETFDYESVILIKEELIKKIFEKEKQFFIDDLDWFEFFDLHREWLQPYAAFCYLRDKYKTVDSTQWEDYSVYDEGAIQELVSPQSAAYDEIGLHYFTQYHLHLQLKDASVYAHKKGIILKADLPIGVGRHSVDTWVHPHLFKMEMQAGAPPDAFAVNGQNWSFPTYNWEVMREDNHAWWRKRMEQLSTYFDAVRIDHVLGFFRIWSIPTSAVQGILGHFVPAIPLSATELVEHGIHFNEQRLCNPYITEEILHNLFNEKTSWVKETFLDGHIFKSAYKTQRAIEAYFENNPGEEWVKDKLYDLLADVILLPTDQAYYYHIRINIFATRSFQELPEQQRHALDKLYSVYFFERQNDLWRREGIVKLQALVMASNNMLLCGEDLGMVPDFVPAVLQQMQILSLQVERMPKKNTESFSPPQCSIYESVVTPSTHDMSTMREWWEEDREMSEKYYHDLLHEYGAAPYFAEPWLCKKIIEKHLESPAMWSVFLLQDLLSISASIRKEDPTTERINIPADPAHVWNYRMHCTVEELIENTEFTRELHAMIEAAGRN